MADGPPSLWCVRQIGEKIAKTHLIGYSYLMPDASVTIRRIRAFSLLSFCRATWADSFSVFIFFFWFWETFWAVFWNFFLLIGFLVFRAVFCFSFSIFLCFLFF
jgi:hypothetical protein